MILLLVWMLVLWLLWMAVAVHHTRAGRRWWRRTALSSRTPSPTVVFEGAAQYIAHLARVVLLGPPEDVALLQTVKPQLEDIDVAPVGNEADECIVRQQIEGLGETIPQLLELILVITNVHYENKHWRPCVGYGRQLILHRGELRNEFRGQVLLGDILGIMSGELIPRRTKGTHPEFAPKVDLTVRVEDGTAGGGGAADWVVGEGWGCSVGERGEWGVECSQWGDDAGCLEAGGGPGLEGEASAVCCFQRCHVPVLILHGAVVIVFLVLVVW
mmetsp:Transcript_2902/g.4218  ORF Transcript_2902/g.4218 Transcript_2902/m.4218 type:complete len:272 (+) Transcript_2902:1425-2240(+)